MRACLLALAVFPASIICAAEPTVERFVVLRDGTVLRAAVVNDTWKVPVLKAEGKFEEVSIHLADLESVQFTPERNLEKKKQLLAAIAKLGSEDFDEREKAQEDLHKLGKAIRADIELLKDRFSDPEIKVRLEKLLADLPTGEKASEPIAFDVFRTKSVQWGDAGDASITLEIDGKAIRLTRKEVASLSVKPTHGRYVSGGGAGAFRQLNDNDYPPGCIEEGFETTPDGRKLKIGENVEKLFIPKGFTLSTSIKTSFVSVNNYEVMGKTHGLSCATHEPLWHGEITITFCKPGDESVPAAVHWFGTWIAYVEVNGTALHAYDFDGHEIGHVAVRKQAHDFLGFYSPVPVHKIVVVPNLQIDPDYTLDDFIFDPPQSASPPHPDRCLVQFTDGETLLCRDVTLGADGVTATGLSMGLPDRTRSYADVVLIAPPEKKEQKPPRGMFVELEDGSIVFGRKPDDQKGGPVFRFKPDVIKESDKIVALWPTGQVRPFAEVKAYPMIARTEEGKGTTWVQVNNVKFEADHISRDEPEKGKVSTSYFDTPPFRLKARTAKEAGAWRVKTAQGDELVIGATATPTLSGSMLGDIKFKWNGEELKLPAAEVLGIVHAPEK